MKIEPKQILEQLENVIKSAIHNSFTIWENNHQQNLKKLQVILDEMKVDLVQNDEWTTTPQLLWQEFELKAVKLIGWVKTLKYLPDDYSYDSISNGWHDTFNQILEKFPKDIRIYLAPNYWKATAGDSLVLKIRKKLQPLKKWLRIESIKFVNLLRNALNKPKILIGPSERKIRLHHLISYSIEFPLNNFVANEWEQFLRAITGQLFMIQNKIDELFNKTLLLDKIDGILKSPQELNIFDRLYILAEILKNVDETLETLSAYEKQFKNRLDNKWHEIAKNFLYAWDLAGTFQLPHKIYSDGSLLSKKQKMKTRFKNHLDSWEIHIQGIQKEWQRDLELIVLQLHTARILVDTSKNIQDKVNTVIKPTISEVRMMIDDAKDVFRSDHGGSLTQRKVINTCNTLLNSLPQVKLPQLLNTLYQTRLVHTLETYTSQIEGSLENLANMHSIFSKKDIKNIPPKSKLEHIALKEIVHKEFLSELLSKQIRFVDHVRLHQEEIFRNISKIDQTLEFNIETALNLMRNGRGELGFQEAQRLVNEGLERTSSMLDELVIQCEHLASESTEQLLQDTMLFEEELIKLTDNANVKNLEARFKRGKKNEKIKQALINITIFFKSSIPFLILKPLTQFRKIWEKYFSSKKTSTKEDTFIILEEKISQFLSDTKDKIAQLPFVYQKLFQFEPLQEERFYTGRKLEMKLLQKDLSDWQNGKHTVTAILGETGSGKTTLIHFAQQNIFAPYPVIKFDIQKTLYNEKEIVNLLVDSFNLKKINSLQELESRILADNIPQICIIENFQNLFLRKIDGLEGLEKLLFFVHQTNKQIFWLFTCTPYAWQFLDKAIGVSKYFKRIIHLGSLSNEEIPEMILKRHRLSGYGLIFESNGTIRNKRKFRKLQTEETRQKYLKEVFFEMLNKLSYGNITIAFLYWLRAIKYFSADELILSSNSDLKYTFLEKLPETLLFTLAAFIYHDLLTADDHAYLFQNNIEQSITELNQMKNLGLLIESTYGYKIHPFLYGPLIQVLKSKNILH